MDDAALRALTDWVWGVLGVPTEYGEFPGPAPCARVKVSPGEAVVRRYRSGGGVYRLPYEVYLKVPASTEGQRIGGVAALGLLSAAARRGEHPDLGALVEAHEVRSAPALYAEDGGADSVYQFLGELRYVIRS